MRLVEHFVAASFSLYNDTGTQIIISHYILITFGNRDFWRENVRILPLCTQRCYEVTRYIHVACF